MNLKIIPEKKWDNDRKLPKVDCRIQKKTCESFYIRTFVLHNYKSSQSFTLKSCMYINTLVLFMSFRLCLSCSQMLNFENLSKFYFSVILGSEIRNAHTNSVNMDAVLWEKTNLVCGAWLQILLFVNCDLSWERSCAMLPLLRHDNTWSQRTGVDENHAPNTSEKMIF